MSHYEQRLQADLDRIHQRMSALSDEVDTAIKDAVHALLTGNKKLAAATILGDGPVNRAVRELDRMCHALIAVHLPSAGHLRLMSAVIRVNIELERIGDYAVTISRETVQLAAPASGRLAEEIEAMAEDARRMFRQAIDSFTAQNADQARATMAMADQVGRSFDNALADLMRREEEIHVKEMFAYFVVFNMLERVSDQSKNICEETVFAVTGEQKAPKVYRVLFLDEDNSCLGPMALGIARKSYGTAGEFAAGGRNPAAALNPMLTRFMEERGHDMENVAPQGLDYSPQEVSELHVIVSLQHPIGTYLDSVPFHTVALEWDLGEIPADTDDPEEAARGLEAIYREIALQLRDLMHLLRGEEGE